MATVVALKTSRAGRPWLPSWAQSVKALQEFLFGRESSVVGEGGIPSLPPRPHNSDTRLGIAVFGACAILLVGGLSFAHWVTMVPWAQKIGYSIAGSAFAVATTAYVIKFRK